MVKKLKIKIKQIPQKPGAYIFKDKAGRILYIGKAVNLKNRIRSHFSKQTNTFKGDLIAKITDIDWIETDDEKQAYLLENELIKKYKPRYNIQWRDDKSYFWVMFSDEEWPRVEIRHKFKVRSSKLKVKSKSLTNNLKLKTDLVGPFVNGRQLRQLLRALRKVLPYRTCKNPYEKPCLQWHLGLCPAHDTSLKLEVKSLKLKKYLNSIYTLSQFLRLYAGEHIRIEAYDISNIHGVWATGSMIVFYGDKPQKSDYRKFKIKTIAGANDIAMIKEVLKRRFGHPEWPYPDLILIDGGQAQLNAAKLEVRSRKLEVSVFALAKTEEEIYTEYSDRTLKLKTLPTELKLIFQAIRNEAHRFAIFYYRHLHRRNLSFRP